MNCDVLVIGSGIAGCMAAVFAASPHTSVFMASQGETFSGSSFYGATWGLGMIAPRNEDDEQDLAATIATVGEGMARPEMIHSFVRGIKPAIAQLEALGVPLRRAGQASQREYIACFDDKHRDWYGIERTPFARAMQARLTERGVGLLPRHELLDILQDSQGNVCGAVLYSHEADSFCTIRCKALVLACGGAGSLFSRNLVPADCLATAQPLAVKCGAQLENYEFLQFMPGLVSPVKGVVFNEKALRFCALEGVTDPGLLSERSTYGPFTCRLRSHLVDQAIAKAQDAGVPITLGQSASPLPEFVESYYTWLEDAFGISRDQTLRIAHYAHASNGGIRINPDASTGVPGLFAAGEVTGGMHGADRLGGLSSANCLVFGIRAGENAARWAQGSKKDVALPPQGEWTKRASAECERLDRELLRTVDGACSIERSTAGLTAALRKAGQLEQSLSATLRPCNDPALIAKTRRESLRIKSAQALIASMLGRKESAGSHFRRD